MVLIFLIDLYLTILILISLTLFSFYELDVIPLPTYSSDEFETISRALLSDTICVSIREKIGNDFEPDNGSIFSYIFNNCSPPITTSVNFKNDVNNLRLMTYNVLSNAYK